MAARIAGIDEHPAGHSQNEDRTASAEKIRSTYQEKFPVGTLVRIANRDSLEDFMRVWKFHNKLKPEQLEYAGSIRKIKSVGFYHGGDVLYQIEGAPGVWHERCVEAVRTEQST
jgi:hypothetical protein